MTVLDNNDQMPTDMPRELSSKGYALSGKVMLSAIVVLFFVVLLMLCFHLYARWYLLRARRRHLRRTRRNRRTQLVFYVDNTAVNPNPASVARGLDAAVLKSLPVFLFSSGTHADPLECAVCLSEFEENEPGRVLPKCNHSFHIECIDMWFHSHSTCPLCRSPVEPAPISPNPVDVAINIPEPTANDPESSSDLCMTCQHEEEQLDASTSSFGARRKPKPTGIQVPRRNLEGFDESTGYDSPSSQPARSPMSRILSFRRILSRDRRSSPSAASATAGSVSAAGPGSELEMEQGKRETE